MHKVEMKWKAELVSRPATLIPRTVNPFVCQVKIYFILGAQAPISTSKSRTCGDMHSLVSCLCGFTLSNHSTIKGLVDHPGYLLRLSGTASHCWARGLYFQSSCWLSPSLWAGGKSSFVILLLGDKEDGRASYP